MTRRSAACSCGQLTAQVTGTPLRVSICHCLACQRRTGSPFAQQARFRRSDVAIAGQASTYSLTGDEGTRAQFYFCPFCAATVYFEAEGNDEWIAIPVGAFADPGFPAPTVSVYEKRMHRWVIPPAGAEHFA